MDSRCVPPSGSRGNGAKCLITVSIVVLSILSCLGGLASAASSPHLLSSAPVFAEDIRLLDQPFYLIATHDHSRHLLQAVTNESAPYRLATSRTDRPNPLDGLKKYRGGYNLSNKDYGASVGYTGLPGWILALIWAFLGLLLLLSLCCVCCCCRNRAKGEYDHGRLGYILPLIALILFTLLALVGSILLFIAQQKFDHKLKGTLDYVVNQSVVTESGLREVSANLTSAANVNIEGFFSLSDSDKASITQLNQQLNNSANELHRKTFDNRRKIKDGINIVRIILIAVAGVMLALVLLGLLFSAIGIRPIVYLLVFIGWLLVIGTWILCGVFIFIDNGVGDTCLAMRQWVENPAANTSLDRFLPCDQSTADAALTSSREFTVKVVSLVNQGLSSVVNLNIPRGTPSWYNQSGPVVPSLCNPYGSAPNYSPVACANNTVTFSTASSVWLGYVCTTDANGICTTQGRLTRAYYNSLTSAAQTAGSLSTQTAFLVDTANCTFVRNVFTNVYQTRCHGLRSQSKNIWIGLALVSAGSMLSILSWIVYVRRKRFRYRGGKKQKPMYKGQSQPYSPTPTAVSPAE